MTSSVPKTRWEVLSGELSKRMGLVRSSERIAPWDSHVLAHAATSFELLAAEQGCKEFTRCLWNSAATSQTVLVYARGPNLDLRLMYSNETRRLYLSVDGLGRTAVLLQVRQASRWLW